LQQKEAIVKKIFGFWYPLVFFEIRDPKNHQKKSKTKKKFFSSENFFLIIFDTYWHQKKAILKKLF
jgi:hypothetical protein